MGKNKVVVTARSFGKADRKAIELLENNDCEIVRVEAGSENADRRKKEEMRTADAVIAGLDEFDAELIRCAPKLKVISRYGVGYDKVDIEAASRANVMVTITPGANGDSVADLAVALMLDAARNVTVMDTRMKRKDQTRPQGVEMWEKTLGVIGTGRIGQGVARRCRGFNMRILGYDLYESDVFKEQCNGRYVTLEELLRLSDFITIHLPLTRETENMIGREEFGMMKKDAVLVNTARGGIVDEQALYEALKHGTIRAAGLDATMAEPPYESPLLGLSNCILTPHAGSATKEASSKMSFMAAQNVIDVLKEGTCKFAVNS